MDVFIQQQVTKTFAKNLSCIFLFQRFKFIS